MSQRNVYEWVERAKGRRRSVTADALPSSVTCDEVKKDIYQSIQDNRRISIDETVSKMSIRHGKGASQYSRKAQAKTLLCDGIGKQRTVVPDALTNRAVTCKNTF
jgi:hypothetical protein